MTYKHWKQLYLAQFTIFPLLVFLIALISMKWLGTFLPAFVAGGLWCLMFVLVSVRLVFWRCPSCGHYCASVPGSIDRPSQKRMQRVAYVSRRTDLLSCIRLGQDTDCRPWLAASPTFTTSALDGGTIISPDCVPLGLTKNE